MSGTMKITKAENSDYYETRFIPNELDLDYPPMVNAIMWAHSLQKNRLIEDLITIKSLELPYV